MTPQQIEALKLALEALKNYAWHGETCPQHPTYSEPKNYPKCTCGYAKVIPALEEALAEHAMQEVQRLGQEIEPVADYIAARDMLDAQPVLPRTWVGLTDEDMYVVSEEESCSFIAGAKWSEAILKEKNT
jgi:hypothetical protein